MQKLVWQNANGDSIDLTSGNYGITQWEGFSNTSLNIQSQQVPFQDGAVFLDALLNQRELSVTLKMQDNGNLEERYRMRRELIHILNPKLGEGYLIYTNDFISKRIKCVAQVPLFETHNSDTRGTPKASLSWTACEPYWEDLEETVVTFRQTQKIVNNGDIPCQIKARYKTGTKNPLLYNKTNNKKIALNGAFNNSIILNTENGKKDVSLEKFNFKWVNGSRFRACCNGQDKNVYVGDICIIEDCLTGEIYNTELTTLQWCVVYSEELDLFVIGCSNGIFYLSTDLKNWLTINSGVTSNINAIIYADSQFIAVGSNGVILTSIDGKLWTQQNSGVVSMLRGITFGNGMFVVTGANGTILTSPDGITWTSRFNDTSKSFNGVVFSKMLGLFITTEKNNCYTSPDGISWTRKNITSQQNTVFYSITCSDNIIITVGSGGNIFTSTNTTNWNKIDAGITYSLNNIFYSSKYLKFLVAGINGTILYSSDGNEWDSLSSGGGENYYGITFSSSLNLFVAIGTNGAIITSSNGKDWIQRISGVNVILQSIIYSETLKKFFIVGNNGTILTSIDGITWTPVSSGTTTNLRCIFYNNNLFLIVGMEGTILTSPDGINWTSRTSGTSENLFGCTFGNELFVAVGSNGTILTSPDGINWTSVSSGTNKQQMGVTFDNNNGIFVSTGGETILISKDGINWSNRNIIIGQNYYSPIYIESIGIFIAVGTKSLVISSIDGIDWDLEFFNEIELLNFLSVAYSEELKKLVIVGTYGEIYNTEFVKDNIISTITPQSDMSFNLEVGENELMFVTENNSECTLSFRQKYLGV